MFVFDTNVLLNIYRFTEPTRDLLLDVLDRLSDRVWLPHRVAFEFFENRWEVIFSLHTIYSDLEEKIGKINQYLLDIQRQKRHPLISLLLEKVAPLLQQAEEAIQQISDQHPDYFSHDPLLERLSSIFEGKVGMPFSDKEEKEILEEGKRRYDAKIPPGYKDNVKEGTRKYGDLLIWKQMLSFAKEKKTPIVFVTGDVKEDWWLRIHGRTIGPRPELIREMRLEAGVGFYMYTADQFLEHARHFLNISAEEEAVQEIRRVQQIQQKEDFLFKEKPQIVLSKSLILNIIRLIELWQKSRPSSPHHSLADLVDLLDQELQNPLRKRVWEYLMSLSEREVYELVVLMWYGRGDYSYIDAWEEAINHARVSLPTKEVAISYMLGKDPLPIYLKKGLAVLEQENVI